MRRALIVLLLSPLITACSSSPPADCTPLSKAAIASINEGAKGGAEVTQGQALKLPGEPFLPMFTWIVAANVKDEPNTEEVFLTVDDPASPNGIFAADNMARLYFNWGEAATKDSPAYREATAAWTSSTARDAESCLK